MIWVMLILNGSGDGDDGDGGGDDDGDDDDGENLFFMEMKTHLHSCRAWPMFAGSQMHKQN